MVFVCMCLYSICNWVFLYKLEMFHIPYTQWLLAQEASRFVFWHTGETRNLEKIRVICLTFSSWSWVTSAVRFPQMFMSLSQRPLKAVRFGPYKSIYMSLFSSTVLIILWMDFTKIYRSWEFKLNRKQRNQRLNVNIIGPCWPRRICKPRSWLIMPWKDQGQNFICF